MVSLVRSGPKILVFKSNRADDLSSFLSDNFNARPYDLDTAFEKAQEDYSIVFIANTMNSVVDKGQIESILMVKAESEVLLCRLLSPDCAGLVAEVRPATQILIMRAMGDLDLVMDTMQSDLGGQLGSFEDILWSGNDATTLVSLTDKPLHKRMSTRDLFDKCLKLDGNHYYFLNELRMHALKYLNVGIGNKDWNEIEIRIFDRYSAYKLHYDRLLELFEILELGLVLGESWSKDYPRLFMSVEVYRVRFFTFHDPAVIKRLLLGMEYLDNGLRIVDYDVYFHQKKIGWSDVLEKADPKARNLLGLKCRTEMFSRMNTQDAADLRALEEAIEKTRI